MEIYILDDLLRRIDVIDLYESFIWTDRWREYGDFELVVYSSNENRRRLVPGAKLVQSNSNRIMVIDTAESKKDNDGRTIITVTGPSQEQIMEDRVATEGIPDSDWVLAGTAGQIARQIFKSICVDGMLNTSDILPFVKIGSMHPLPMIPESNLVFSASIPISTVYAAVKDLCDVYDLGFRISRYEDPLNGSKVELIFDIYTGYDRTTKQIALPPVIFSPDLDNLSNVTELTSSAKSKNVAYVFGLHDTIVVYGEGIDSKISGFDRRVIYVDALDIKDTPGPVLTAILSNKGLDELSKSRPLSAFDGEINQDGKFKYGRDYELGDLVEMRNIDGATNIMRVTEQIFVSDSTGDRAYPTLTVDSIITAGSWDSWGNDTWDSGDRNETWDE